MAAGTAPLERCGERIARLASLGARVDGIIGGHEPDPADAAPPSRRRKPRPKPKQRKRAQARSRDRLGRAGSSATGPACSRTRSTRLAELLRPARSGSAGSTRRRELILTILTQNTADMNAETRLRRAAGGLSVRACGRASTSRASGWGGVGLPDGAPPDWAAVESAPIERARRRHPAGRPRQPEGAADPGDAAPDPRGARRLLARVPRRPARDRGARLADADPRDRQEDRVGAAAVLLRPAADAGRPSRRAGRQADRAAPAEGPAGRRPRRVPRDAADSPDQMYETHVLLIHHGRAICQAQQPEARALPDPRPLPVRRPEGAVADTRRPATPRNTRPGGDCLRASARARIGYGTIRWTGLPLMLTPQVVVSLAAFIWYSIFHQPASVSPAGVSPPEP